MAPVKRKTTKKATTTANISTLKNLSNDPFLDNQPQQKEEEELSINKSNNSFNSKNPSPKKLTTTTSKSKTSSKDTKANNGMNLEEMKVMLEDFDLEAAAQIRSLTSKMEEKLEQTKRYWKSTIENLDSKTSNLLYKDFLNLYNGDFKLALQSITTNNLVPKLQISNLEQSVRKRKRVLDTPVLQQQGDDSDDVFGIPLSANNTTAKKARSHNNNTNPPSSVSRNGNAVASTSKSSNVNRAGPSGRNLKGMIGGGTPGSRNQPPTQQQQRFNRLSVDPSTNFIYRVDGPLSLSTSAPLTAPPTPHLGGVSASAIKRKPRRGESIIMLSVNDSPLGYLMADEVDDNQQQQLQTDGEEEGEEDGEGEEEEEEGEEWDLMERHEASRVEEQGGKSRSKSKKLLVNTGSSNSKTKGKGKLVKKSTPAQIDLTSSAIRRSTRAASTTSTTNQQSKPFNPPQQSFTFGTSSKQSQSQQSTGGGGSGGQDDFLRKMEIYLGEMNLGVEAKNELREKMKGMF